MLEARDQLGADRVGHGREHDRNVLGRADHSLSRRGRDRHDHVRLLADELLRDLRRGRRIALRALELEVEIVALHEAFGGELVLDAVARGIECRMLDDRGDGHGLELLGESGSGGQEQRQGSHGAERSGACQSAMREH